MVKCNATFLGYNHCIHRQTYYSFNVSSPPVVEGILFGGGLADAICLQYDLRKA